ncbi:hypothetical protein ACKGJY_03780 [Hyunsoonleella sp. 2307UL5-6]|uniref:hypothetical protein n=1 Tax=Hyunsoonleella sp. 2307UL5-6 TaxID=3384768 RepID=UPI0039BC7784
MKNIITTSKAIAAVSFIIGTILFALQMYTLSNTLIRPGVAFIAIATIVNILSLLALIFLLLNTKTHKIIIFKTIGIVLLNIPVALLYFRILIKFI